MSLTAPPTLFSANNMKIYVTVFLMLLCVSFPVSSGVAVTIRPDYDYAPAERTERTGFFDDTPLTREQRDEIAPSGNDATTLGEARRNALEYALDFVAAKLGGNITVRVGVKFDASLDADPPLITLASAVPCVIQSNRLPREKTIYPRALAKSILNDNLAGSGGPCEDRDLNIAFNDLDFKDPDEEIIRFYYGFDEISGNGRFEFVSVVLHEIFHGLGFFELVEKNGSWESFEGIDSSSGRTTNIQNPSIYDVQMYSEDDETLFHMLSPSKRAVAIISENGLSWDGRTTGATRRSCSYGQLLGGRKTDGISPQGRPLLHAPSEYLPGTSISHFHVSVTPDDILEPRFPVATRDMTLALALLKDMGWRINDRNIPTTCTPPRPSDPGPATPPPDPVAPPPDPSGTSTPSDGTGSQTPTAGGSSGGCAIASDRDFGSGALSGNLFLTLTVLLLAVFGKRRPEKRGRWRLLSRANLRGTPFVCPKPRPES